MVKRGPLHQRSTLGYIWVSLLVAFVGSVVFTPLGGWVQRMIDPPPSTESSRGGPSSPTVIPNVSHLDSKTNKSSLDPIGPGPGAAERTVSENETSGSGSTNKSKDLKRKSLLWQYDSSAARFSSVEASLLQRARDLGGLPLKPEITAAIENARSDLVGVKVALDDGDVDEASLRLNRVEEALKYLESL